MELGNYGESPQTTRIRPQNITIDDKKELYRCYLPFIKDGGIFIPFNNDVTAENIYPGMSILVLLSVIEPRNRVTISGKVVWIQKSGAVKGFGISLGSSTQAKSLKDYIEMTIADLAQKKEMTYTI